MGQQTSTAPCLLRRHLSSGGHSHHPAPAGHPSSGRLPPPRPLRGHPSSGRRGGHYPACCAGMQALPFPRRVALKATGWFGLPPPRLLPALDGRGSEFHRCQATQATLLAQEGRVHPACHAGTQALPSFPRRVALKATGWFRLPPPGLLRRQPCSRRRGESTLPATQARKLSPPFQGGVAPKATGWLALY